MAAELEAPPRIVTRTFCQVLGQNITAVSCLQIQGQEGCFGCSASTRLCETCKKSKVDVPAVGMCSLCLKRAIEQEPKVDLSTFAEKVRVPCQIVNRQIAGKMCLATQGQEGCQSCPVKTRLCEKCKERTVRFKVYGLCLTCSVEQYGEGWVPGETSDEDLEVDVVTEQAPVLTKVTRSLDDLMFIAIVSSRTLSLMGEITSDDTVTSTDESTVDAEANSAEAGNQSSDTPVPTENDSEKTSQVVVPSGKEYKVTVRVRPSSKEEGGEQMPAQTAHEVASPQLEFEKLVHRGRKIVIKHKRASVGLLAAELEVSRAIAKEVIDQLEKDGVVGPERPKTSRQVLTLTQESPRASGRGEKPSMQKARELLPVARELIIEHRNAAYDFVQRELKITWGIAKEVLKLLEEEGVVGPGIRVQQREILVEAPRGKASSRPARRAQSRTSFTGKVDALMQFVKFFGDQSEITPVVREIIQDIHELKRIKETLRSLVKE